MRHCPDFCYNARLGADVAQLVEQRIRNAKVASSIPAIGTSTQNLFVYSCTEKSTKPAPVAGFLLSGRLWL